MPSSTFQILAKTRNRSSRRLSRLRPLRKPWSNHSQTQMKPGTKMNRPKSTDCSSGRVVTLKMKPAMKSSSLSHSPLMIPPRTECAADCTTNFSVSLAEIKIYILRLIKHYLDLNLGWTNNNHTFQHSSFVFSKSIINRNQQRLLMPTRLN